MSRLSDLLPYQLDDLAGEVGPLPVPYDEVRRRARGIRRRRVVAGLAVAAVVAAAGATVTSFAWPGTSPMPVAAPDGPFLGWPVIGNATSSGLLGHALGIWDSSPSAVTLAGHPTAHTDLHPLLVDHNDELGGVVIVEGRDGGGAARLAIFTGSVDDRAVLQLRVDRPAPDPVTTRVVSLVTARLSSTAGELPPGSHLESWLLALGAPGITRFAYRSTAVDQALTEAASPDSGRQLLESLPPGATPINTTVTAYHSGSTVFTGSADGGAIGDAVAVPASVVSQQRGPLLRIQVDQPGLVAAGQLVATPDGLVGKVLSVSGDQADVLPVTASSFAMDALTDITYHPVRVTGAGGSARLDHVPPDAHVLPTNRIVVADPAQHSQRFGTLTVGRVGQPVTAAAGLEFGLDLTVKAADVKQVFVMVDYATYHQQG